MRLALTSRTDEVNICNFFDIWYGPYGEDVVCLHKYLNFAKGHY